jgi:hypothetical protein
MNFEQEIRQVRDILVIMVEIQRRQAEVQKMQAEGLALHEERMKRLEANLAEVGDTLQKLALSISGTAR